jgi:riboflavin biosynthesis pyrimidine reductase
MTGLAAALEVLLDTATEPLLPLPAELEVSYGGPLGLVESCVFANFVSSLDGVVSIPALRQSSALISDRSEADRFVMGVLRACADVVLVGSGTLRGSPASLWTAERVFPDGASAFSELRSTLGLPPTPLLALLTASGDVDAAHPALHGGAIVLTTEQGAGRLARRVPEESEVVVLDGDETVDARAAIDLLRSRGHGRILSEAGPSVHGSLLAAGVLDELFLTISPLLAGRASPELRLGLVEGRTFLPDTRVGARLIGVRRHGGHLFLRYRLE